MFRTLTSIVRKRTAMNDKALLTRKRVAELITDRVGIPMTANAIAVACSRGHGPKPAAAHGRVLLYDEDEALAWGWSLAKPIESDVA